MPNVHIFKHCVHWSSSFLTSNHHNPNVDVETKAFQNAAVQLLSVRVNKLPQNVYSVWHTYHTRTANPFLCTANLNQAVSALMALDGARSYTSKFSWIKNPLPVETKSPTLRTCHLIHTNSNTSLSLRSTITKRLLLLSGYFWKVPQQEPYSI